MGGTWSSGGGRSCGERRVQAWVDSQQAINAGHRQDTQHLSLRHHQTQLAASGGCAVMSQHQLANARGVTKDRRGHVRDHDGDAGGEGHAQLLARSGPVGDVDLSRQRNDHRRGRVFRIGHGGHPLVGRQFSRDPGFPGVQVRAYRAFLTAYRLPQRRAIALPPPETINVQPGHSVTVGEDSTCYGSCPPPRRGWGGYTWPRSAPARNARAQGTSSAAGAARSAPAAKDAAASSGAAPEPSTAPHSSSATGRAPPPATPRRTPTGHPDGARTHGSGGSGLGKLVVILLAVALLGPAVTAAAGLLHLVLIVAGVIVGAGATVLPALLVWRWRNWKAGPAHAMPPIHQKMARAASPLPKARRPPAIPGETARELPGGLHLHFHGVSAEDVSAIIARQQEGR